MNERENLWARACVTIERRGKTELVRLTLAGVPFREACLETDRLHPFPSRLAPEEELRALAEAYPAALAEYHALIEAANR